MAWSWIKPLPGAPTPPFLRVAMWAYVVGYAIGDHLFDSIGVNDAGMVWRRAVVEFTRDTPSGTSEDKATISFDFHKWVSGNPNNDWEEEDYENGEFRLTTFLTAWAAIAHDSHTATEVRWYQREFSDEGIFVPTFKPSGPPVRIEPIAVAGTDDGAPLPYQASMSVTERTAIPRHWGRFYLPGIAASAMTDFGRFTNEAVDTIANAATDMVNGAASGAGLRAVVPITQVNKQPVKGLLHVSSLQVDDIPDVIRRRRPREAARRTVGEVTE